MLTNFCVVPLLLLISCTWSHSYLMEECKRNPSSTINARMSGDGGYKVDVVDGGGGSVEEFEPGMIYTITIMGDKKDIDGFIITSLTFNETKDPIGTFILTGNRDAIKAPQCMHIIMSHMRKSKVNLSWKAPMSRNVCVEIKTTVMENRDTWYRDDGKLSKIICPKEQEMMEEKRTKECCACGSAKYEMMFEGIWSHDSHPVDYPTQKRLLHWSNIVGASHIEDYHIWKYGGYATKGVKEVCELGYPRSLEKEIKMQSKKIRSLIKTKGIWWKDPMGIVQNRTARFSVDSKRHFVSIISMLGPSPDWCVGIDSRDVCMDDCSWSDGFVVDLLPWDAGTDDGISYMSPNAKSDPQKRIKKITHMWPNHPQAPFFSPNPIPPVARIHIKKIGEQIPEDKSMCKDEAMRDFIGDGSDAPTTSISAECMVTEWDDWSKCSVTCGVGTRVRRRRYKMAGAETKCSVELMEVENCIGLENECESTQDTCGMTQWSEWSPCSTTCGQGSRSKVRYYFDPEDETRCNRSKTFKEICQAGSDNCHKKDPMVCKLPMEQGPCRGEFQKWYHDVSMNKCLPFQYGGCRGNGNNFDSMEECASVCSGSVSNDADFSFCMEPSDKGTCDGDTEMWYFDKDMLKCLSFRYSGCGGNRNRFSTLEDCSDGCLLAAESMEGKGEEDMVEKCQQPPTKGECSEELEQWYFDTQMKKCLPFQYGGCGGNNNRFETMDECTNLCTLNAQLQDAILKKEIKPSLNVNGTRIGGNRYKRFCALPAEKGPCRGSIERWFFDLSSLKCLPFEYGGCVGNANNFHDMKTCQETCLGEVSTDTSHTTTTTTITTTTTTTTTFTTTPFTRKPPHMPQKPEMHPQPHPPQRPHSTKRMKKTSCVLSQWTEWSQCSSTCGKGVMSKRRRVIREGHKCSKILMRKKRCENSTPCPPKCNYGSWSPWSTCSATCGMAAFKQRVMVAMPSRSHSRHPSRHHTNQKAEVSFKRPHSFIPYRTPNAPRDQNRRRNRRNVRSYQYQSNNHSQPNYHDQYHNRIYSRNSRSTYNYFSIDLPYTQEVPPKKQRIHIPINTPVYSHIYPPNPSPNNSPRHPPNRSPSYSSNHLSNNLPYAQKVLLKGDALYTQFHPPVYSPIYPPNPFPNNSPRHPPNRSPNYPSNHLSKDPLYIQEIPPRRRDILSPLHPPKNSPNHQVNHPSNHPTINPSICPSKVERVLCKLPKCYF